MSTFFNNKIVRLIASAIIALLLGVMVLANRNNWFAQSESAAPTEATIDCPQLENGCSINLNGKLIQIKSDTPLEVGKPFTLDVEGEIASARAVWRMVKMDMGPNNYILQRSEGNHWQALVTLPPCPHGGKSWQLHLEVGMQAVNINTMIRDDDAENRREKMHKKM